jgi:hypothetical protein
LNPPHFFDTFTLAFITSIINQSFASGGRTLSHSSEKQKSIRNYFVDEAGDGILFDRKGRPIIGTEGCSKYFILGLVDIVEPEALSKDLSELRKALLSDPYFSGVPSMQPKAKKTALAFHAKDDLPEVRREVFAALMKHDIRFFAVVRDKRKVLDYVRQRNITDASYRYHPNELYDYLVRSLFKDQLHKDDAYHICFACRGKSDRTEALAAALEAARRKFTDKWGIESNAPMTVMPCSSSDNAGLQAVDYFLWALQRFYERREDRFLNLLWPAFRLVRDDDDWRNKYGEYYTKKKPLTLAALK